MQDLISRQAAIDALERSKDKTAKGDIGGFYNTIIQNDIDKIKKLPSAQPEETCNTCKHSPFGDSRCEKCRVGRMSYPSYYERGTDGN